MKYWSVIVLACVHIISGSGDDHFLGGGISFSLENSSNGTQRVKVQVITSWVLGKGPCGPGCTSADIGKSTVTTRAEQEHLYSENSYFGTFSSDNITAENHYNVMDLNDDINRTMSAFVLDVNEAENCEQELMTFLYQVPNNTETRQQDIKGKYWGYLDQGNVSWHILSRFRPGTRNDTGKPNTSPVFMTQPVYRIQLNRTSVIKIPVFDADGDVVRCRKPTWLEAGAGRDAGDDVIINPDCTVEMLAFADKGYINDTWMCISLEIEDFNGKAIEIGSTLLPSYSQTNTHHLHPVSSIGLHIAVHIVHESESPKFVKPTEKSRTKFIIYTDTQWVIKVYAEANEKGPLTFKVTGRNMEPFAAKSSQPDPSNSGVYYSTVSWTPIRSDLGLHIVCINAVDSNGTESVENVCYILDVKEAVVDPCNPDPCVRGTCFTHLDIFFCLCPVGYTGLHCETDINECYPDPCETGATCINGANDFTCICRAGYQGRRCEQEIDECQSSPCRNNGTCTDGVNSYTCDCVMGFAGYNCRDSFGPKCFSCNDISDMTECTTVTTCERSQMCGVDRYQDSTGRYKFNLGCKKKVNCTGTTANISGDACTQCCDGDYCNPQGCSGLTGLEPKSQRGPICFDCDDVATMAQCKSVSFCGLNEVCTVYGSKFTHFDGKCYDKTFPCGTHSESLCHSCCHGDFCNTNCTSAIEVPIIECPHGVGGAPEGTFSGASDIVRCAGDFL